MNIQKMMKQMQKVQGQMNKAQSELEGQTFIGEAGGGMVSIEMNGKSEIQKISLKPDVVDPDDIEALEDLILAAFNQVKQQIDSATNDKMGGLTAGMKIPGM